MRQKKGPEKKKNKNKRKKKLLRRRARWDYFANSEFPVVHAGNDILVPYKLNSFKLMLSPVIVRLTTFEVITSKYISLQLLGAILVVRRI